MLDVPAPPQPSQLEPSRVSGPGAREQRLARGLTSPSAVGRRPIRYAAMAQSAESTWKYFLDQNSKDFQEYKSKGVKIIKTPKEILTAQLMAWDVIVDRESKADPFFAKVIDSQKKWAARVVPLRSEIMVENQTAFEHYFKR